MPRFIKKSFFERSAVVLAVGGGGPWEVGNEKAEERKREGCR